MFLKKFLIFSGDIIIFYASLLATVFARYGSAELLKNFVLHAAPFSLILFVWLAVFYIADFYEPKNFKNNVSFAKNFALALVINAILSAGFFYFISYYGIAPKTNLIIFIATFGTISFLWRLSFNSIIGTTALAEKVFFVISQETPKTTAELIEHLSRNPQLGYQVFTVKYEEIDNDKLAKADIIVVPAQMENPQLARFLYDNLGMGIKITTLVEFYENIFRKIPLSEVEETWFIKNIASRKNFYDAMRRALDLILAIILIVVILPIALLIAILIKITSKGPIVYQQKRTGAHNINFTLYKFRTMRLDAEIFGPQWASAKDPRVTIFGKILRQTHLDEIPQLINILKGDISFVGPRPERPEFITELNQKIPYYEIRHVIKPGLTGWAQINYRYGASVEDSYKKLQYDIYYIKNRSFFLDFLIIAKTIKFFFVNL